MRVSEGVIELPVKLLLDTAVIGQICHPRRYRNVRDWFRRAAAEHDLLLSEVVDYELRRELIRIGSQRSLARLDELARELRYLPITTDTWRSAATLWAFLRRSGRATAAAGGDHARSASWVRGGSASERTRAGLRRPLLLATSSC